MQQFIILINILYALNECRPILRAHNKKLIFCDFYCS